LTRGVERGHVDRLHEPPRPHLQLFDGVRQLVEVFDGRAQAGARHEQRAVVVGEALGYPQGLIAKADSTQLLRTVIPRP